VIGTIPDAIGSLHSLRELYLFENTLSGPFPLLPDSMFDVRLYKNNLYGLLPDSWPQKMSILQINHNKLSGPINSIYQVSTLRIVELHRNEFNGTVSAHFGSLEDLNTLTLHKNNLSGSIPDDVCALRKGLLLRETNKLSRLSADCLPSPNTPKVQCSPAFLFEEVCCTECHE